MNNRLDKTVLKKLIKEVLNELDLAVEPELKGTGDDVMKHSVGADTHKNDTVIKLVTRGAKPNKGFKKAMALMAYAAKMADLEIIRGEAEKDGRKLDTLSSSEIEKLSPVMRQLYSKKKAEPDENDKFDTTAAKSVNRKTNKNKPAFQGDEGDWKNLTNKDADDTVAKTRLKNAKIAAGTFDPEDQSLWTDKEWAAWEERQRQENPEKWAKIDQGDKARAKAEPKPEDEEPEKPVAGS